MNDRKLVLILGGARSGKSSLAEELAGRLAGEGGGLFVANEVGLGLVPPYPLGRAYRDLLGRANQRLAAAADEVYLLVAGLPVELKALAGPGAGGTFTAQGGGP